MLKNLLKLEKKQHIIKRQLISQEKKEKMEMERKQLEQEYEREITRCEKIKKDKKQKKKEEYNYILNNHLLINLYDFFSLLKILC